MNTIRTLIFMSLLAGLMMGIGYFFGGKSGLVIGFIIGLISNISSYWFSDKIALKMSGARPLNIREAPELYQIVSELAAKDNLPMPSIHLIESYQPNAFATGRDSKHAAIAVTTAILNILDYDEIRAVLAHELSHVKNNDILITTIACVFASVISYFANVLPYMLGYDRNRNEREHPLATVLIIILAPILASIINLAISRSREYQADESGAKLCADPMALARALTKIENYVQGAPNSVGYSDSSLSSLYIIRPGHSNWFLDLMSTHPPTNKRIARLENIERKVLGL